MDGARFANSVAFLDCHPADITWRAGVDVLSFGATKNGALGAEAVVFFDPTAGERLRAAPQARRSPAFQVPIRLGPAARLCRNRRVASQRAPHKRPRPADRTCRRHLPPLSSGGQRGLPAPRRRAQTHPAHRRLRVLRLGPREPPAKRDWSFPGTNPSQTSPPSAKRCSTFLTLVAVRHVADSGVPARKVTYKNLFVTAPRHFELSLAGTAAAISARRPRCCQRRSPREIFNVTFRAGAPTSSTARVIPPSPADAPRATLETAPRPAHGQAPISTRPTATPG